MKWGVVDVGSWIRKLPKGTLNKWLAFDAVEPIGEEWRQTAETNQLLTRLIELQAIMNGVQFEPATIEDCMPQRYEREPKPKAKAKKVDPKKQFHDLANSMGFGKVIKQHGRIDKSS